MLELRRAPSPFSSVPAAALLVALTALSACDGGVPPAAAPTSPTPTVVAAAQSASVSSPAPELARPAYGYPETRRENVHEMIHGVSVADPYRWLEDGKLGGGARVDEGRGRVRAGEARSVAGA